MFDINARECEERGKEAFAGRGSIEAVVGIFGMECCKSGESGRISIFAEPMGVVDR